MLDIFNSDAFSLTSLAAALKKIPYKPSRLGPGGLALFDERPISTLTVGIEEASGQLSLIGVTPRGSAGDIIGDSKRKMRSFNAQHLSRSAKVMADEVQGVRVFGTEDQSQTIEAKVAEKLATLQAMHELTWEYHRVGALLGKVLDADGTTTLLDVYDAFGLTQATHDFPLTTSTTDVRSECDTVADLIDEALGGVTYDHVHALCGGAFYDTLIKHKYVQDVLKAQAAAGDKSLLSDLRSGFTIGAVTFERAKRWKATDKDGNSVPFIGDAVAYAFPVGATTPEGSMFIGRFAPQPFMETVNRLNPPLVVKSDVDTKDRWVELLGVSCPLYLNTRPEAVIKLTKS
jgi:hypothetical protein